MDDEGSFGVGNVGMTLAVLDIIAKDVGWFFVTCLWIDVVELVIL